MASAKPYETKISNITAASSRDFTKVRELIRQHLLKRARENDESHHFDFETTQKMYSLGLLNCITPKEFGGADYSVTDLICAVCEIAYGSGGLAATFIGNLLGYSTIVLYGNPKLRSELCTMAERNFQLWSFAMTEKVCGSDLKEMKTTARRVPGGFLISGEKNFITNATFSNHLAVFCQTQSETGTSEGISCFYIPGNTKGLTRGEAVKKMGWRESNTGHLHFADVFVPNDHVIGKVGEGMDIFTRCLNRSKTLLAAVSVGISYRALDLVHERLSVTKRFGKQLLDQSAIRHILARLHTKVEATWLLAARSASVWDSGEMATKESSMAKLFGGATGMEVTSQCVELFGALGYLAEYEVSRLLRDAKAVEIVEGPSLVQELIIAKQVLPTVVKEKKISLTERGSETSGLRGVA